MFGCRVHSRMYTISKNPSMFITGRFYCISKNMFVFSFSKPSTFWIGDATFLCFYIFGNVLFILWMICISISRQGGFGGFLSFNGFLSCAIRSFFNLFILILFSYQSVCSRAMRFSHFFLLIRTCFHMRCIHKYLLRVNKFIFHTVFKNLRKICSKRSVSLNRRV